MDHEYCATIPSIFRKGGGDAGGGASEDEENPPTAGPSSTIDIELSDGTDCVVFSQCDMPNGAFPLMEELRRQGHLIDVTILVGKTQRSIDAHKLVLASTIPYFHAMFTNGMKESSQHEIHLDERGETIDSDAFEALINFAYSGKVSISTSNVQSLMMTASFLQLSRVRDACAEFLMARLSANNVLGIKSFADSLGCSILVAACHKFVKKFFAKVAETEEFLALPLDEVSTLVGEDELFVVSEAFVFNAVLSWVKVDRDIRSEHLPFLLAKVRLPLLTPQFLSDTVASDELIRASHKCRDLLDEARDYHLMPERRSLMQSFRTKPRRCRDIIGVIYAVGGQTKSGNSLSTVEVYDPITGRWKDAEAMSMLRSRVGVAVMKNRLYAIGGYNGTERLNTVEVFDSVTKRWSRVASMNFCRSAVGAVAVCEFLYVCGGFDGISSLDTVERYDPDLDEWKNIARMNKNRSAAGVVHLDGKIYALGGHNGLSIFESVESYDTRTGGWEECRPMLSKRCRLGVAALNGKIYAVGGYDGSSFLKSVEVFDPMTNKWSYVSSMKVTRSRVAVVANMDRLWAIGGYDGMKNLSTVEMYNPDTNEWSFVASMEKHEGGVGVGVIPMEE